MLAAAQVRHVDNHNEEKGDILLQQTAPTIRINYDVHFRGATADEVVYKALAALDKATQSRRGSFKSALCTMFGEYCGEECSCSSAYIQLPEKSQAGSLALKSPQGIAVKPTFEGWSDSGIIALSAGLAILLIGLIASFLVIIWDDKVEREKPVVEPTAECWWC